jgi:hypothetical protein
MFDLENKKNLRTKIDEAKLAIDKIKVSGDTLTVKKNPSSEISSIITTTKASETKEVKKQQTAVDTLYITSTGDNFSVSEQQPSGPNVFKMTRQTTNCWTREEEKKVGGATTKKRMRMTKRHLKGKRGLKSRVKSRVKTSRS